MFFFLALSVIGTFHTVLSPFLTIRPCYRDPLPKHPFIHRMSFTKEESVAHSHFISFLQVFR